MSDQRFLVTARKYRPQLFAELVAQEHVTGTLKNAVRLDRLAHAYLFTGPRGVGKTTAARILAKAINCTTPLDQRDDQAEPCRQCDSCRSFEESRNLNIIEIDAASNNKVDDVRDLRETVRIPPQGNRKKVYIVDEVHMLTTQAFNALLKTLEEPPPHVLFIFATTEPHKVLPTIQSRCQRFDFRRIPVPDVVEQLRTICRSESIRADEGSLVLIARRGDGALRDALSVFDQAVSLCGEDLSFGTLVEALGVVNEDLFFETTSHAANGDPAGMLRLVDEVVRAGYDLQEFLDGLAEHLRNLLVARTMPDAELIEASTETRERYLREAPMFEEPHLLRLLALVDRTMEELRVSRQPRLRLELAMLRMATLPSTVDLKEALARLDAMGVTESAPREIQPRDREVHAHPVRSVTTERRIDHPRTPHETQGTSGSGETPGPTGSSDPRELPVHKKTPGSPETLKLSETPGPRELPGQKETRGPQAEPEIHESLSEKESAQWQGPTDAQEAYETADGPGMPEEPLLFDLEDDGPPGEDPEAPPPLPVGPTLFDTAPSKSDPTRMMTALGKPALTLASKRKDPGQASMEEVAVSETAPADEPEYWDSFMAQVKTARIQLSALLVHVRPGPVSHGALTMIVPDELYARVFRDESSILQDALKTASGGSVTAFRTVVHKNDPEPGASETVGTDPETALKTLCEEYPAMRLLMERFGGEIVW